MLATVCMWDTSGVVVQRLGDVPTSACACVDPAHLTRLRRRRLTSTHPSAVVSATDRRQGLAARPGLVDNAAGQLLAVRKRLDVNRRNFIFGLVVVWAGCACGGHTTTLQTGCWDVQGLPVGPVRYLEPMSVEPAQQAEPSRSIFREHLGLIITAVPLIVLVLRVMLASKGDGAVLSALVRYSDTRVLLTMSIVALVPTVVLTAALGAILTDGFRVVPASLSERQRRLLKYVVIFLTLYYLTAIEWPIALTISGLLLAFFLFGRYRKRRDRKAGVTRRVGFDPDYLVGIFFSLMAISTVWFPLEHIVLNDGVSKVGYVLNVDDPMVVLWKAGSVEYLKKADVKTRQLCDSSTSRSLIGLRTQRTPECPQDK